MSTAGEDILAWLNAAIAHAEETAQVTAADGGASWRVDSDWHVVRDELNGIVAGDGETSDPAVPHIALHDPESVLRRCAADRKILELHALQPDGSGFPDMLQCRTCSYDGEDGYQYLLYGPCPTLLALAEGYGWTEGER